VETSGPFLVGSVESVGVLEDGLTDEEIRPLAGASTNVIDAAGRTVIPGIVDSHCHPDSAAVEVSTATGFGPEYDRLWERVCGSFRMCVRRDAAYLDWKYRRCPHRDYLVREARREGALVGFCVTREDDYRGLRLGWLLDVFAGAGDAAARDALIGRALEGFRASGVARAQAFSLHSGLGADLERRGFRRGPSPMQFCVRSRVESEGVFERLGDWHVVFGDSDMDR